MYTLTVAISEAQLLFQKLFFRAMQCHIFTTTAQCHIKRLTVKRLCRHNHIFRSPSLRLMRSCYPAIFESRVILRKVHQPTFLTV
ncbi:MAG: hypothetical protein J6M38_06915 [Lentisphaeria bacterium]|nr:hypothetical protein [Lentisphaeria bacterium]